MPGTVDFQKLFQKFYIFRDVTFCYCMIYVTFWFCFNTATRTHWKPGILFYCCFSHHSSVSLLYLCFSEENSWTAISALLRSRRQDPYFKEDEKPLKLLFKKLLTGPESSTSAWSLVNFSCCFYIKHVKCQRPTLKAAQANKRYEGNGKSNYSCLRHKPDVSFMVNSALTVNELRSRHSCVSHPMLSQRGTSLRGDQPVSSGKPGAGETPPPKDERAGATSQRDLFLPTIKSSTVILTHFCWHLLKALNIAIKCRRDLALSDPQPPLSSVSQSSRR